MSQLQGNPDAQIHPIISGRWSPRAFDSNIPVESKKLQACLEAARWSSSCFGEEPWRFIVSERSQNPDGWQQMLATLAEKNQLWAQYAPVLVLACAANNFSQNGNPNRWSQYDTGQAMISFSLQAVSEGLITHPMGGFNPAVAAEKFNIPDDFTPMSVTALGYQGKTESLDKGSQAAESSERNRKPISEITFTSWNKPWQAEDKS